jgi:NADPH:quinone reductase-like Zn-dependent oxidoreductase
MMIEVMGGVAPGDRVLVHAAGGGVGLMALDLLKARGAWVVGTSSSSKHPWLLERGYDELIDYTRVDFEQALAGGPGLDLILDPVGGASWAKGLRVLRPGGRLICFGMSSNATSETRSLLSVLRNMWAVPWGMVNPIALMNHNHGVMGVNMGKMWGEGARVRTWLDGLMARWEAGTLRPHVHAVVPFAEAAEAHAILHRRENLGKVVLIP